MDLLVIIDLGVILCLFTSFYRMDPLADKTDKYDYGPKGINYFACFSALIMRYHNFYFIRRWFLTQSKMICYTIKDAFLRNAVYRYKNKIFTTESVVLLIINIYDPITFGFIHRNGVCGIRWKLLYFLITQ